MNAFPLTLSSLVVPSLNFTANVNAAKKKRHVSVYCVRWMRFHALFGREHYFSSFFQCGPFTLSVVYLCVLFVFCKMSATDFSVHAFFSLGFQNSVITFKDLM